MRQLVLLILSILCLHVVITCKAQVPFTADSCLIKLIDEALEKNTDVRTARLTIVQTESILKNARLAYLPSFAFAPSYSLTKAQGNPVEKSYALPITMDWEINLGGRQRYEKQIAKAKCEEANQMLDYLRIQVVASIANAYYTLVMLDQQIAITQQSLENQENSLATIRAFKEIGKASELAINQTESNYLNTKASLKELKIQRYKTETAILLLLNRKNGPISRSTWNAVRSFEMNVDSIPLSQLSSRPDVKAAEMQLVVACGNESVANASFYPTLRISADAGWTNNIGEIVDPAKLLLKLICSLTQPIFNNGVLKSQKEIAIAQRKQAELAFEKTLLVAGKEIENALFEKSILKQKLPLRKKQVEVSKQAYENCKLLQNYSQSVTYIDVLLAQESYLNAQLQETADWLMMQQASINLYKALCPQP